MTNKNNSLDFNFDTARNNGFITQRDMIKTPAINKTDNTATSINVAPRLNDFPDNTGNIANNGIDNKSWNNNTENI